MIGQGLVTSAEERKMARKRDTYRSDKVHYLIVLHLSSWFFMSASAVQA